MESNVAEYQVKIERVLQSLLTTLNCQIDQNRLNTFLSYISDSDNSSLTNLPNFTNWVLQAVSQWQQQKIVPVVNLAAFTLNLTSLLSKSECKFSELNNNNFYIKLVNVTKARQLDVVPSNVKLAYVRLLCSFLEHDSGVEWMLASSFWEDPLKLISSKETDEIINEAQTFLIKILEKTINCDEIFCGNVVKKIIQPLGENVYKRISAGESIEINDEEIYKHLRPVLQLIGNILEYFLEQSLLERKDLKIALVFLSSFHLEERISDLMFIAQNKHTVFDLCKIMFFMQFLELYSQLVTRKLTMENYQKSIKNIMSIFLKNIAKCDFDNFLKFCHFGQLYWKLMGEKISIQVLSKKNEPATFANQLATLQLLALLCIPLKYCYSMTDMDDMAQHDDIRNLFVQKMFGLLGESALRIGYSWKDQLLNNDNLFDIVGKSLNYIMNSRKYYSKQQVTTICQACIYCLGDLINSAKDYGKLELFQKQTEFFTQLFDTLTTLIEQFHITWRDSLETIDVMSISFDFLTIPGWSATVVVKGLKLVNTSIAKYMSPNLALLVDNARDSTVALVGPLLYIKLHDDASQVRNAALEVVCTISNILNSKFPSLQKVLMDSELPCLVVKMSTCDGESFVRATAIKCLQEMIKVEDIWNDVLKSQDLFQKMRQILLNETEGIVRVEAASFMCVAYEHQQFADENLDKVYEIMIHSSTTDLHWEVKVRALGFWDQVIKNHLQNQGMIDGSFPNVTFSKEHRKIVTLNDSEIRKRLMKVLNQLSTIGCLGVLVSIIKDDCDMEVSKTAVKITQQLVSLLKKYNIKSDGSLPTSPQPTENGMSSSTSISSGVSVDESMGSPACHNPDFSDDIIDQIVNSKDVSLLKNVYSPSDYGSVLNFDVQVRKIISPAEFLQFIQQDLNVIITEKKNWLNGIEDLGSLLDDMLKTYDADVNSMDCY